MHCGCLRSYGSFKFAGLLFHLLMLLCQGLRNRRLLLLYQYLEQLTCCVASSLSLEVQCYDFEAPTSKLRST